MNKIIITENTENMARLHFKRSADCIFRSSDLLALDSVNSVCVSDNAVGLKNKNVLPSFFYLDYLSHVANPLVDLPLCDRVKSEVIVDK